MCLILLTFAACGFVTPSAERVAPPAEGAASGIHWRDSRAVGTPSAGRLVRGVQLPAAGVRFFTWDPLLHRRPDRPGRRWGTDVLVRRVLRIVSGYAAAHPSAPRVGIGDLSRRRGGPFGPRHASHQNGLDVDVYYPRRDRTERPPRVAAQIDRRLSQDLVDRFVAAGAVLVFVGPNTGLTGPAGVVETLWNHDNHLHARFESRRRA
jgi:murein endopeptidase